MDLWRVGFAQGVVVALVFILGYYLGAARGQTQARQPPKVFLVVSPGEHPSGSPLASTAYRYSERLHRINLWRWQICGSEPIGAGDIQLDERR